MKLPSYRLPVLPGYRSKAFLAATREKKTALKKLIRNWGPRAQHEAPWVYLNPVPAPSHPAWQVKLYVCVQPPDYWPCVDAFIRNPRLACNWKFFMDRAGYERPDKIVFYPSSGAALAILIRKIRPLLNDRRFHELRHAASTTLWGLDAPRARGLYLGCDPAFLRQSWRMYRATCSAWAALNERYLQGLPGGKAGWFEKMNLSLENEGPFSLNPDKKNIRSIRRYWALINAPA